MDWRNIAVLFLLPGLGYLLAREFSRKDKIEAVVLKLSEAVIALQQAVKGLEKFSDAHSQTVSELQKEFHNCKLDCPYRGGGSDK